MIKALKSDLAEEEKKSALSSLLLKRAARMPEEFKVSRGKVSYKGQRLEPVIEKRFLELMDAGLPLDPIKKFITNLSYNPSESARTMLYTFLEHNGHPLTENGCFIAYKSVRSDYKDWHTGTIQNNPGLVVTMDRDKVDENPNSTCSSGLHVAAWDYAASFHKGDNQVILEIEVDPRDVVSVPVDYNGTKMRVCRYRSIGPCATVQVAPLRNTKKKASKSYKYKTQKTLSTKRVLKSLAKKKPGKKKKR